MNNGDELIILAGHKNLVSNIKWNPAVKFNLASTGFDQTIKVWDVNKN